MKKNIQRTVTLDPEMEEVLSSLAKREDRTVPAMARILIKKQLAEMGFLPTEKGEVIA